MYAEGSIYILVKLQRPPPVIRILRPAFLPLSRTKTDNPACPTKDAQKSPAAPAPIITVSYDPTMMSRSWFSLTT